ncbi:hypothetical protein LY78DRAFT_657447 [Colletotrichum sublineola]|nr:hypothetical protein LY78DRAFT_657447 [Colletotrichum sublineola]
MPLPPKATPLYFLLGGSLAEEGAYLRHTQEQRRGSREATANAVADPHLLERSTDETESARSLAKRSRPLRCAKWYVVSFVVQASSFPPFSLATAKSGSSGRPGVNSSNVATAIGRP